MITYHCDICKKEVDYRNLYFMKFSTPKLSLVDMNKEVCLDCFNAVQLSIKEEIKYKEQD